MKLVRSHAQVSQPALHAFGEKIDESRMIVGAGDLLEGLAARAKEGVTSLLLKLFEGLQTVGREGRRQDEE